MLLTISVNQAERHHRPCGQPIDVKIELEITLAHAQMRYFHSFDVNKVRTNDKLLKSLSVGDLISLSTKV